MLKVNKGTNRVIFDIKVMPKSSRNEVTSLSDGTLKVKITAPPVGGAANKECIKFLAKSFGVRTSSISIIKGERNRKKRVIVTGMNKGNILRQISKGEK